MERNWSRAIAEILSSEGGYSDNSRDPGGATNLGVTIATFREFVKPDGTVDDLKALTREQAAVVFRRQYWDKVMGSALPDGVDYCVTDFAVNSGDDRAERMAQQIAGASIDGKIGDKTLTAIHSVAPAVFINRYCDGRIAFLKQARDKKGNLLWPTFGDGWSTRVAKVRNISMIMASQPPEAKQIEVKTVTVDKPVPMAVIPKGADKRTLPRIWSALPMLATPAAAWGNLDNTGKIIIVALGVIGVAALLFFGERIAVRAKAVLASFES